MAYGFVKIYGSKLITSSLWDQPPEARLVFLSMLAIADQNGYVDVPNERALARVLNLPEDYLARGLEVLMASDKGSRTPRDDGRRIVRQEPGWKCVNYEAYREFRSAKQEADRRRIAAQRARSRDGKESRNRLAKAKPAGMCAVIAELDRREMAAIHDPPDTEGEF